MSFAFDGNGDYLSCSNSFGSISAFACCGWFKFTAAWGSYDGLLFARTGAGNPQGMSVSGAGTGPPITYGWEGTAGEYNAGTGLVPLEGRWAFLAFSYNAGAVTMLIARHGLELPFEISTYTATTGNVSRTPADWMVAADPFDTSGRAAPMKASRIAAWSTNLEYDELIKVMQGQPANTIKPHHLKMDLPLKTDTWDRAAKLYWSINGGAQPSIDEPPAKFIMPRRRFVAGGGGGPAANNNNLLLLGAGD